MRDIGWGRGPAWRGCWIGLVGRTGGWGCAGRVGVYIFVCGVVVVFLAGVGGRRKGRVGLQRGGRREAGDGLLNRKHRISWGSTTCAVIRQALSCDDTVYSSVVHRRVF